MGLGKTLTMIALAASDLDEMRYETGLTNEAGSDMYQTDATLIIVPPPCESPDYDRLYFELFEVKTTG